MARILIADTPEGSISLERILKGHETTVVSTIEIALSALKKNDFDLIITALHFDESQMFELIREIRQLPTAATKPVICFCSRETPMAHLMHESLELSTRMLGAWMYLSEHAYNVYQDPDAELRRVIERCLTEEARKEILHQRMQIQNKRTEIQQLRLMLETQDWSPEMNEYLEGLKSDLELLLGQVTSLQFDADTKRASVHASRTLRDRVSEQVTTNENGMTELEEIQFLEETRQTFDEIELTHKEDVKHTESQRQEFVEFTRNLKEKPIRRTD